MSTVVRLRPSQSKNPTVTPRRGKNAEYRSREYLTEHESEKLLATARKSRNPTRDSLGTPGIHGLQGDELRLIRALMRENGESSRFLSLSERKAPLSTDDAQKLIE